MLVPELADVPLWRLYLLRALYLLVVVGLGVMIWPDVIHRAHPWELMEGVSACMLASFSLLSLLGLRYPLRMLPLLLWELAWKVIWLLDVPWPLWREGRLDAGTAAITEQVLWVVILPFVIPWRHVLAHYVRSTGDRWR